MLAGAKEPSHGQTLIASSYPCGALRFLPDTNYDLLDRSSSLLAAVYREPAALHLGFARRMVRDGCLAVAWLAAGCVL